MFRKSPTEKIKQEVIKFNQLEEERRKEHVEKMLNLIEKCYNYQNKKIK